MGLRLFNTLSRTLEEFVPLDPQGEQVRMYCCGPTVHDSAHIGNFRTFVFADLVRRHLEFKGLKTFHVMNITDVEDKIIARVRSEQSSLESYTRKHERSFLEDLQKLGCAPPHCMPRASEHIREMVDLIQKLIEAGFAYPTADGSVYFNIEKYRASGRKYGQLINLNFEQMRPGERVSSDEYGKESLADFALWKAHTPEDGEVFWPSPWGKGRPGWHIECSAMSMKLLGPSFDLHLGGEDLIFPHHEDEIAQSEGAGLQAPGQRFVKYWLHCAHLLVEGRKMSKSLGNYFTLHELLSRGFEGHEIRYLLLSAHYRESFNFTLEGLQGGRSALNRLFECRAKLKQIAGSAAAQAEHEAVARFTSALDDDLNVSAASSVVFEWLREHNKGLADNRLSADQAASALATWDQFDSVFNFSSGNASILERFTPESADVAPVEIRELLEQRQAARKARDFKTADALREEIKAAGWIIEDTPQGTQLKRS